MSRRDSWDARYAERPLVWSAGPNSLFAELVTPLAPGRALDVACGEGRNAIWLAEQGWQVTGIDFSRVGIDKARQIAGERGVDVDWLVEDLSTYQLPRSEFDLVAILYLHTDPGERARWLKNVVGALAPGGTLIYIGHDPTNISSGVGGPQNPALLPDAAEIVAGLPGFQIDRAEVVQRPVTTDPGHGGAADGIALDTLVLAVRPPGN